MDHADHYVFRQHTKAKRAWEENKYEHVVLLLPFQIKMKVTHLALTCFLFLLLYRKSVKPFLSTKCKWSKCKRKVNGHLTIVLLNSFAIVTTI